jgi:hypothetical protein
MLPFWGEGLEETSKDLRRQTTSHIIVFVIINNYEEEK